MLPWKVGVFGGTQGKEVYAEVVQEIHVYGRDANFLRFTNQSVG